MRLDKYSSAEFDRGRSRGAEALWVLVQALFVSSWLPGSWLRIVILRLFGAKIAAHVIIKPRVSVKFPWRLVVGEWSWIGERVWIDNLAEVRIGNHAVISLNAYLCTGNHDMASETFDLVVKPIVIEDSAWIGAGAIVGPGAVVGTGAVLSVGSVAWKSLQAGTIYRGNPATAVGMRQRSPAR